MPTRRTRLACFLLATLVAAPLFAGCFAAPREVDPPLPGPPVAPPPGGPEGFDIVGLHVGRASGESGPLHEDDVARVSFALVNRGRSPLAATHFVTLRINDVIVSTEHVTLEPDERTDVAHTIRNLRDLDAIHAEVRSGGLREEAHAEIHKWPRTREETQFAGATVTVLRWLVSPEGDGTQVSLRLARDDTAVGAVGGLRAASLCVAGSGEISRHGDVALDLPPPGTAGAFEVVVPACPGAFYGLELTAEATADEPHRILFVPRGWQPAGA